MDSLQERFAPNSVCFGCGPKNPVGLRIRSFPRGDSVVCRWSPRLEHSAFAGYLSGGIVSVLLDCHSNWAAAYSLMRNRGSESPPGTVTAEYTVRFVRPTPMGEVELEARAVGVDGSKVKVDAQVVAGGKVTATSSGLFIAVKEGHPAFDRWR
jgi:acyl-coenzyme A thioesterase PaaI-like protein